MSETSRPDYPYKSFGSRLKKLRVTRNESIAEVSGAVEIDPETLTGIECGQELPNEDILALLISYFNIKEDEADTLWRLAGYDKDIPEASGKTPVFVLPDDLRVVYTDIAHIAVNKYGVVMNFMQTVGPGGQPLAISRVGMSREQAEHVLTLLQQALHPQPKVLPANTDENKT